jgi:hypothetical protein
LVSRSALGTSAISGREFIVHCFAIRADAEFFQTYFGGEFVDAKRLGALRT